MQNEKDEQFMQAALREARKAAASGEVPVGAVLVYEDAIIARAYNQVELLQDATAHAEMLVIGAASAHLQNWRLLHTTLYTTLEPCVMCAGAMWLSRIGRLVWGAPDLRQGANGSFVNLFSLPHPMHTVSITSGVLAGPCSAIIKDFFRERRECN